MKQAALPICLNVKKTRKAEFLEQMERVVPWAELVALIAPYYPEGKNGRPPFPLETMLRTHFLQLWFTLSDPATEEAFFDVPLYREFAQLPEFTRLPDESTILRFRHRLEKHKLAEQVLGVVNGILSQRGLLLKTGTVVDATLIAAPTSTKNQDKARDPEMHSSKKGNQWYFGMKAHIGADAKGGVTWHVAMRPGKRRALNKDDEADALLGKAEKLKAAIRAKVEHPFWSDQAPVRLCEGALPGASKEHGAPQDLVCALQPVDGAAQIDGRGGMSAPEIRAWCRRSGAGAPKGQGKRCDFKGLKPQSHNLTTGWRLPDSGAGYSEHPKAPAKSFRLRV